MRKREEANRQAEPKIDNLKITEELLQMKRISETEETKIKSAWKECENFFFGAQWGQTVERKAYGYNSYGEKVVMRHYDDEEGDNLPRRTQNEIFIQMQTELSLHLKQNYFIVSLPVAKTDRAERRSRHQNLYLIDVLGKAFANRFIQVLQDVLIYGDGFVKIVKKSTKAKTDVPFKIIRIPPQEISADPHAREFENVRWIIHRYKKYAADVAGVYPKLRKMEVSRFTLIELEEFWVRRGDEWKRYVLYKNIILNEDEDVTYPIHPFTHFKHYNRIVTWWGLSEAELFIEHQRQINKRLSQYDMHLNMSINPPVEVNSQALSPGEMENFPLKPFEHYTVKQPNAIRPIVTNIVSEGHFFNSIENSRQFMRRTGGIHGVLEGSNDAGVYSAKHFGMVFESAINRLKLKESFYRLSFQTLGEALLDWGRVYLSKTGYFIVYDPASDRETRIESNDLVYVDTAVSLQTSDANLLNPQERLQFLIQMKQYAPELDAFQLIIDVERMFPTFFDPAFIRFVKNMQGLQRRVQVLNGELQELQLQQRIAQLQQPQPTPEQMAQPAPEQAPTVEQPMPEPAAEQPMPEQQAMAQPVPAQPEGQAMPSEEPVELSIDERRFLEAFAAFPPEAVELFSEGVALLEQAGLTQQQVIQVMMQVFEIARQQGIVDQTKIAEIWNATVQQQINPQATPKH